MKKMFLLLVCMLAIASYAVATQMPAKGKPRITAKAQPGFELKAYSLKNDGRVHTLSFVLANKTGRASSGGSFSFSARGEKFGGFGGAKQVSFDLSPGEEKTFNIRIRNTNLTGSTISLAFYEAGACDTCDANSYNSCQKYGGRCEYSCTADPYSCSWKCCEKCKPLPALAEGEEDCGGEWDM